MPSLQLITYADAFDGHFSGLRTFLERYGCDAFDGVHILPFYPSSGDRGFAPISYREVDAQFGTWDDVRAISQRFTVMADFMVNHLSRQSPEYQDLAARRDASPFRDLFLHFRHVWPDGEAPAEDLAKIYTRKPRPPYTELTFADGETEKIWCTFDYEQIDLDVRTETTQRFIAETIAHLASQGVRWIRLDAFAYAIKKPGTNCFFVEPDVWQLLGFCADHARAHGIELLPEIHEHHRIQLAIANQGYWVYDFALPMLVLHTLFARSAARLTHWLQICPRQQFTTLDTHDGIGVVDVADLLSPEEIAATQDALYQRGANVKRIYNTAAYGNLDIYQMNCTYYSALGENDTLYLLARAIQFFTPGTPQVYYVGALAGRNDVALVEATKNGRDINRHNYTLAEVEADMARPVVRQLFDLMAFRRHHPAFDGALTILSNGDDQQLHLRWQHGKAVAELRIDLAASAGEVTGTATTTHPAFSMPIA